MQIRKFQTSDYPEYKSWYKDPIINSRLGPMDEEWLEYVLQETDGAQYSILDKQNLIAVIGVSWGTQEYPFHVITDLLVHPKRHRQGIGRKTLDLLFASLSSPHHLAWLAFVSPENQEAISFFQNLGWINLGLEDDLIKFSRLLMAQ